MTKLKKLPAPRKGPMSVERLTAFLGADHGASDAQREMLTRAAMRIYSTAELPICGTGEAPTSFFVEGRRSPCDGGS